MFIIMKTRHILTGIIAFFLFAMLLSSCATTQGARIESERMSYMLHDKSEYPRNKGKYKGSSSYEKLSKKNKRRMRQARR